LRNVLQDAPQVGWFHVWLIFELSTQNKYSVFGGIQIFISCPKRVSPRQPVECKNQQKL